ncbi:MAG: hypothetical protein AAB870_05190 [Patescibacteria group bacterium]
MASISIDEDPSFAAQGGSSPMRRWRGSTGSTLQNRQIIYHDSDDQKRNKRSFKKEENIVYISNNENLIKVNNARSWGLSREAADVDFVHSDITEENLGPNNRSGIEYYMPVVFDPGKVSLKVLYKEIKQRGLVAAHPSLLWAYLEKEKDKWEGKPRIIPMNRTIRNKSHKVTIPIFSTYYFDNVRLLDLFPVHPNYQVRGRVVAFKRVVVFVSKSN